MMYPEPSSELFLNRECYGVVRCFEVILEVVEDALRALAFATLLTLYPLVLSKLIFSQTPRERKKI